MTFESQGFHGQTPEVKSTQGMMEAGMQSPGVHKVGEPELLDAAQTLKKWMFDEVKNQVIRYSDETINRVIENLTLIR